MRKRQPDCGLSGFGGSPVSGGSAMRCAGSMLGADANNAGPSLFQAGDTTTVTIPPDAFLEA